ncbi:MAG: hypothetical protein ABIQ16_21640 [Polyangiaceae bacterium]
MKSIHRMIVWLTAVSLFAFAAFTLSGCGGSDGKDGAIGPAGARGPQGDAGPQGDQGSQGDPGPQGDPGSQGDPGPRGGDAGASGLSEGVLTTSCMSPCHGFTGIVEQWKSSTHYATFIANLGGEEVPTWTGPTACGNCHSVDAIEQRVAGNVTFSGTAGPKNLANGQINYLSSTTNKIGEATYAGQATVAQVGCSTCHDTSAVNDPHLTGAVYQPGSFPLRVPTRATDQAVIEKSSAVGVSDGTPAGQYGRGNACIWCHKSRKDVTNFITASNVVTNTYWGPHEGPQSDIYTGKGGYHYLNVTYGNSSHQAFTNGCVKCHMAPVASNQNVGDHSYYAQLSTCQSAGCHSNAKSFDVAGGQSAMKAGIQELRVALNDMGWLTRGTAAPYGALSVADLTDQAFSSDLSRPSAAPLTADQAGALYNYLLLARGAAGGVHNPIYVRELVFDSVKAVTGSAPVTIPVRP